MRTVSMIFTQQPSRTELNILVALPRISKCLRLVYSVSVLVMIANESESEGVHFFPMAFNDLTLATNLSASSSTMTASRSMDSKIFHLASNGKCQSAAMRYTHSTMLTFPSTPLLDSSSKAPSCTSKLFAGESLCSYTTSSVKRHDVEDLAPDKTKRQKILAFRTNSDPEALDCA
jgi:hypothetical protein